MWITHVLSEVWKFASSAPAREMEAGGGVVDVAAMGVLPAPASELSVPGRSVPEIKPTLRTTAL